MYAAKWKKLFPILALFVANFISLMGSALTTIAIPWFVLQTTGSVIQTGVSAFFTVVPGVIANLLGGVLIDRVGYKRMSVISDVLAGVGILLIPLFYHTVGLPFAVLLVLLFLATLLNGPGGTARLSLVPDLANLADMPFERATSLSQGIGHLAVLVGAPLAGLLIFLVGTSNLLWIDALSFAISALIVGIAVPVITKQAASTSQEQVIEPELKVEQALPEQTARRGFLGDFQESMRFILVDKLLLAILLAFVVTNMIDVAFTSVATPFYVKQIFGSAVVLGAINAAFVGGALVGTLLYGSIGHRLPRALTLAIALVLVGLRLWAFALVPPLAFLLVITVVSGFASSPLNPIVFTIAYERIPQDMRGRVLGVGLAFAGLGMPLGVLGSGYLLNGIGIQPTLLIMGACYLLVTLGLFLNPDVYKMKKATKEASDQAVDVEKIAQIEG